MSIPLALSVTGPLTSDEETITHPREKWTEVRVLMINTHLGVSKARMTVESSRPSLEVTCATYWGGPRPVASTTLEKAELPEQSHREPGRWQQSPVVMATRCLLSSGPEAHGPKSLEGGQQRDQRQN